MLWKEIEVQIHSFPISVIVCNAERICNSIFFFAEYFRINRGRMPRFCSYGLGFLPACFSALCALTIITTYIMAVCAGHVYAFFPTISETGVAEPERNIFSLMLSLGSFLGFLTIAVRYVQYNFIAEYIEQERRKVIIVNRVCLVVGTIVCIGGALVASFQVIVYFFNIFIIVPS